MILKQSSTAFLYKHSHIGLVNAGAGFDICIERHVSA